MTQSTTPDQAIAPYVPPYTAVGISTVVYTVSERRHISVNLQTIEDAIHAAMGVVSINLPVKLIALPEGALTGFPDEIFNIPHVTAAREIFIDIPGEETEWLGRLARHYETYLIFQCKARWPEIIPDRYFNTLAVINPEGQVVHKAAKNHVWCREHSTVPHDVYSRWVEVFGDGIDAFYPVLRTPDIGVIGTICCSDGEYPEAVRALAFNGAEVVYRPSEAIPMTGCTVKLNVALRALPDFKARPGTRREHHLGQINTPLSKAEWKAAFAAARAGRLPDRLWTELYFQSAHDRSVAPDGVETMSVFAQYVPHTFAQGDWDARRDEVTELALASIGRYCRNIPDDVLAVQTLGPPDIERTVGLTGGHIFQGECLPAYMWVNRLDYRTPMPGVFLCGACTHPGGSVIAINGRNAALDVLGEL